MPSFSTLHKLINTHETTPAKPNSDAQVTGTALAEGHVEPTPSQVAPGISNNSIGNDGVWM